MRRRLPSDNGWLSCWPAAEEKRAEEAPAAEEKLAAGEEPASEAVADAPAD
jgi:hypothetical protein